jgi:hypothetical protein
MPVSFLTRCETVMKFNNISTVTQVWISKRIIKRVQRVQRIARISEFEEVQTLVSLAGLKL